MSDLKQTIADFYTASQSRDFARDFNFRVLNINFGSGSSVKFDTTDLVYCKGAQLPAREIGNVAVPYMGLQFNVPGAVTYPGSDSYTLKFYLDEKSQLRQKFEKVSRDTFDDATSTGNYFMPRQDAVIDLVQLDKQNNPVTHYQLVGVSIRKVGEVEYTIAEGKGEAMEFEVTIAYHYFRIV